MQVDLFETGASPDTRPAWQLIEAARRRYLTGRLELETNPPTNVYLRDGQVYFAERTTDGGLGVRLLVEGVVTREQMQRSILQVSGVEHLGRMFDRDDSIDREAVELCVELMTDDVLIHVADEEVQKWRMKMYQRHPSGLDRWLPTRVEVITHLVDSPAVADPDAEPTPAPAPRSRPQLAPPPVTGEMRMPTPLPTLTVPVIEPPATTVESAPMATTTATPAATAPAPAMVLTPTLTSGSLKDEVAEAVRQALASIEV